MCGILHVRVLVQHLQLPARDLHVHRVGSNQSHTPTEREEQQHVVRKDEEEEEQRVCVGAGTT